MQAKWIDSSQEEFKAIEHYWNGYSRTTNELTKVISNNMNVNIQSISNGDAGFLRTVNRYCKT
jgi:GTP pyrophosphokinase